MAEKINKEIDVGKLKFSAFFVQFFSSLTISSLPILSGFVYAWPSYTVKIFTSNETELSWPMSTFEVSILGSITNIGALVVTPFCGYAVNTLGRKNSAVLFGIPYVLGWLIISLTSYVPLIIASIGLAGMGSAGQAISCVYISEISHDSIRGGLTSTCVWGFFVGLLFSYILGGYLTYRQVIYTHLSILALFVVLLALLKESPVFLIQRGREEEAAKSLAFYFRVDVHSKVVEHEIKKIKLQLDLRVEKILQGENDPESVEQLLSTKDLEPQKAVSSWKFLKNSESSKRALAQAVILMFASIMMGAVILQVYAEPLFKKATPTMPSNLCAILIAVDMLVSSLICAGIVDKCGRKFLMTTTSAGAGVFTLLLATQLQLEYAPNWVTAVFIYMFIFVYNLGASVVPFILTAEIFLPEVRGLCNSVVMAALWLSNFVTLIIFNPLVEWFGLGVVFYGFSTVCFLTALYSQLCLPETKGLPCDAIQLLFVKKKKQTVEQRS